MVDLNMYLTGGVADGRMFKIIRTQGWVVPADYMLDDGMLTLTVTEPFAPAPADHAEDALILVEAMDTDGESAVLYVKVRGNLAPTVNTDAATEIGLTVGTQNAASGDGDDPDYYVDADGATADITCPMLNACYIDLTGRFSPANLRDSLTFRAYVDPTITDIEIMETDTGVMIMGRTAQATAIPVRVWAVDEGGLPMNAEDTTIGDTDDGIDQAASPPNASVQVINVTVDGQPLMSTAAVGSIDVKVGEMATVGHVFDEALGTLLFSFSPTVAEQELDAVAQASMAAADATDGTTALVPARRAISVTGINRGTVMLSLKMMETAGLNEPTQYTEHDVVVNVSP